MEVPKWFTKELLQSFLRESGEEVLSYEIGAGTKPGDGFLSNIYRVTVKTVSNSEMVLLMKTHLEDPEAAAATIGLDAFPKEVEAYKVLLPDFQRLWLEHSGASITFGPKCYFATAEEPLPMIVMEDLRPKGYEVRDRKVGFNFQEMKTVFATAARFHACSVKRFEETGPYDAGLYTQGVARDLMRETVSGYYGTLFEPFLLGVEQNVDNGSTYLPNLQKLRGKQFDILDNSTLADPDSLNVLCHSDLWVNNILFKKDNATDVKFIDFQISQWTSPAIDLIYIFFTSCQPEVIVTEWDNLIKFYYEELSAAMKVLQCKAKVSSFEEFNKDLTRRAIIGLVYITETLALSKADSSLNLGTEALMGDSEEAAELRTKVFSSPEYVATLNLILPFMDKRGFLEIE